MKNLANSKSGCQGSVRNTDLHALDSTTASIFHYRSVEKDLFTGLLKRRYYISPFRKWSDKFGIDIKITKLGSFTFVMKLFQIFLYHEIKLKISLFLYFGILNMADDYEIRWGA